VRFGILVRTIVFGLLGGTAVSAVAYRQLFPLALPATPGPFDPSEWRQSQGRARLAMAPVLMHQMRSSPTRESVVSALGRPDWISKSGEWSYHLWGNQDLTFAFNVWGQVAWSRVVTSCGGVAEPQVMMGRAVAISAESLRKERSSSSGRLRAATAVEQSVEADEGS
jgi:hypothetical protein